MITYRTLSLDNLSPELFSRFDRRQVVTDCWRREGDCWVVKPDPFVDDWSEADRAFLVSCLHRTIRTGGVVLGAFLEDELKGFVSVEGVLLGEVSDYADVTSLHVSADMRHHGIGRTLFEAAGRWAKARGAKYLYLSTHSAVETQAFYAAMGCRDARWHHADHVKAEPFDRQLEFEL